MFEDKTNLTQFQKKPFAFLFFITKQYRLGIGSVIMLQIMSEVIFVSVMVYVGRLTDALEIKNGVDNVDDIYQLAFLLIGVFVMSFGLWRISGLLGSTITTRLEARSLNIIFNYLIGHSHTYFTNQLVGKLSSKVSNIARSVDSMFPMLFWDFVRMVVKFIAISVVAFYANVWLGIIFISFIVCFTALNIFVARKMAVYSEDRANKASDFRGNIVDDLTNVLAIKQNVQVESEIDRIAGFIDRHRVSHIRAWRYFEIVLTVNAIIALAMYVIVILGSLQLWKTEQISAGIVIMAIVMTIRMVGDLVFMGATLNKFMEQYGQLKEGLEEILVPYSITDKDNVKSIALKKGEIIFDNVCFNYENDKKQAVFEDLSILIKSGQKIGLVGESGAGKSTFVSLLLRFMDVDSGSIIIDGYNIKDMRQDDLRSAIAYVPQEALLFHRTLEDNIKYSNQEATKEEILEATRRAHALDFINNLPQQFDTLVGERGVKLSGGQKQRVMIARAMLKNSPILILDEATSSLDSHAEKLIQEALEELMKDRTTIVIAHRLSTLKKMDRIIVFDGGKIVEDGTHQELLDKKGKYFELWQHQTNAIQ